jgi:hypothetical protein
VSPRSFLYRGSPNSALPQMNKLLFSFLAACIGALGFALFHRNAEQNRNAADAVEAQSQAEANDLGKMQDMTASLRDEVQSKKKRLRQAQSHSDISPEMLLFLEGHTDNLTLAAWAKLRQELGLGWDSSPSDVLVSKQAIKKLDYVKLQIDAALSDTAVELLALTADEQSAIKQAIQQAREGQWLNVQRGQPGGDIVAQYTIQPPDPAFMQSQSNNFAANIASAVGPERAGFLLPQAWREFVNGLTPNETETMTIRQVEVNGQPDLMCEVKQGDSLSTSPVRYAQYPAFPVLELFRPRGWETLAQMEGFTLPPSFQNH